MLCQICQKSEATVHVQELVGQTSQAIHVCQACAQAKGLGQADDDALGLAALICKLAAGAATAPEGAKPEAGAAGAGLSCPVCGLEESDFRKTGRAGCAACYRVFGPLLADLLPHMHRGVQHRGKRPGARAAAPVPESTVAEHPRPNLEGLRQELARAVAAEAYERAAELRDTIQRLTNEGAAAG